MGKNVKLTIRLSQEDMTLLKSHTAKTRLSQSAYLRMLIRGYVPKSYPPEMFYELMGQLNRNSGKLDADVLNGIRQLQETVTAPEKIE
jgi:Ribbon-helix-helix protein, copG family.